MPHYKIKFVNPRDFSGYSDQQIRQIKKEMNKTNKLEKKFDRISHKYERTEDKVLPPPLWLMRNLDKEKIWDNLHSEQVFTLTKDTLSEVTWGRMSLIDHSGIKEKYIPDEEITWIERSVPMRVQQLKEYNQQMKELLKENEKYAKEWMRKYENKMKNLKHK